MLTRIAPSVFSPTSGIYVTSGSYTEKRSSCAWAYEKSIKISFYPFQERGLPLTGWRDSIDRQIGPADYARARDGEAPVHECLSPSLWNGLYLTLCTERTGTSVERDSGHTQATLLTHLHGRTFVTRLWTMALIGPGELLIAGARRIWLSIASFAERTFLISVVFRQSAWVLNQTQSFQRVLHTRARAHACGYPVRVKVPSRANESENIRLENIFDCGVHIIFNFILFPYFLLL